jgi:hypothetical protein
MRFKETKLQELEKKKAEEEISFRIATTRPRNGARPRSSLGLRQHRPKSAMSTLESMYTPQSDNRQALHIPRQTKSFDVAIQCGRLFDDVDPSFAPRLRKLRAKQLEESIAVRLDEEHTRKETIRSRRNPQRERFQSLAYGRFVASVRREEPHAVSQYRHARGSSMRASTGGRGSIGGSRRSSGSGVGPSWLDRSA